MTVECFWMEEIDQVRVSLRRYVSSSDCPAHGIHDARVEVGVEHHPIGESILIKSGRGEYADDDRWPTHCECGHEFGSDCKEQVFKERLYRHERDGPDAIYTLRTAPPGAMWDAKWRDRTGPDGRSLMVKCPNGAQWFIDGRASNCTRPDDDEHRCWVREGEPPNITAGKNGNTCSAGAGSIQAGDYHGFLRNGKFT